MASLGSPKTWTPYMNNRDCSQGFCSVYCPRWCYAIFPPPPSFEFPEDDSSPNFSPLVIAIIGILASAFLLVSYYTIISKYCGNSNSAASRRENDDPNVELEDNHDPSLHEPWHVATAGLDEALIRSITVCKYKRGEGLIEGTDCSVCLSEFQEDESVRLLPKCSHAFHVPCIDTWLRSHSNCPLCRAHIIFISANPFPQSGPPVPTESPPGDASRQDSQRANENGGVEQELERQRRPREGDGVQKSPLRVFSDLGVMGTREEHIRRSVSMDHSHICLAEMKQDEEGERVDGCPGDAAGSSSSKHGSQAEGSKWSQQRRKVLHCGGGMKRSFSSGRFFVTRHDRVVDANAVSPV